MKFLPLLVFIALSACTSVKVIPVPSSCGMKKVTICSNPVVRVDNFLPVLREGFARHGIAATVDYMDQQGPVFTVRYSALRSWDVVPYLSKAEIYIEKDGVLVGSAEYRLRGKGGFSPMKWAGTQSKIDPVMDALLKNYP